MSLSDRIADDIVQILERLVEADTQDVQLRQETAKIVQTFAKTEPDTVIDLISILQLSLGRKVCLTCGANVPDPKATDFCSTHGCHTEVVSI